uniref:XPG N-terminal domain-containing protein n=1 Tax=Ciona savignyi TaxID=51511 RepID=H2YUZ8_CIOSA
MGVLGLWKLLEGSGRPVNLESMEGKILAVDISIWLNMAVKGMRDLHGQAANNAHLITLFHRLICKLLYFGIPVFVFDGGAPALKKRTLKERRQRKEMNLNKTKIASEKVLQNYLKRQVLQLAIQRGSQPNCILEKYKFHFYATIASQTVEEDIFNLPAMKDGLVLEESDEEREDQWMQRSQTRDTVYGSAMQVIDVSSDDFKSLPSDIQHELLLDIQEIKKRRRTQLEVMPEESSSFSNYQLSGLLEKRKLTSQIRGIEHQMKNDHTSASMSGYQGQVESSQISSDNQTHYILLHDLKQRKVSMNLKVWAPIFTKICIWCDYCFVTHLSKYNSSLFQAKEESKRNQKVTDHVENNVTANKNDQVQNMLNPSDAACDPHLANVLINSNSNPMSLEKHSISETMLKNQDVKVSSKHTELSSKNVENSFSMKQDLGKNDEVAENNDIIITPTAEDDQKDSIYNSTKSRKAQCHVNNTTISTSVDSDDNVRVKHVASKSIPVKELIEEHFSPVKKEDTIITHKTRCENNNQETNTQNDASFLINSEKITHFSQNLTDIKESFNQDSNVQGTSEPSQPETKQVPTESDESDADFVDVDYPPTTVQDDSLAHENPKDCASQQSRLNNKTRFSCHGNCYVMVGSVSPVLQDFNIFLGYYSIGDQEMVAPNPWSTMQKGDVKELKEQMDAEDAALLVKIQAASRAAQDVSDVATMECQELLRLFGIPFVISPQEAEAQCAFLDYNDLTMGTITDDSDIWLFGGRSVYKDVFNRKRDPTSYSLLDIKSELGLERGHLINIALCSGSDYTTGIDGVGPVRALEMMKEFPEEGIRSLVKFKEWWNAAHKQVALVKAPASEAKIKTELRRLNVPQTFPSSLVVDAYLKPRVSESLDPFTWGLPDLSGIREYLTERLHWTR